MHPISKKIINTIRQIAPGHNHYPLHEPVFRGNEKKYLMDCIDSGYVSSIGPYVTEFENRVQEFTGSSHAIAVVNGTAALQMALVIAGVKPNDEVLVPTLTFVATANAVAYCGAIPHFTDSRKADLGLDVKKLSRYLETHTRIKEKTCFNKKTGRPIRALVAVHVFGMPVDMDPLKEICTRFGLALIEDAAESLGSFYKGKHTGTFGMAGALSFNGNKTITTGGGGILLIQDNDKADLARHLTTTAKTASNWTFKHDRTGYNFRLPNLNAALGCAQMEMLPEFLRLKRRLASAYANCFSSLKGAKLMTEPHDTRSSFWLNTLLLDKADKNLLHRILTETNQEGIHTRPVWQPMHRLAMYEDCPGMNLDTATALENQIINLPSSSDLAATPKKG